MLKKITLIISVAMTLISLCLPQGVFASYFTSGSFTSTNLLNGIAALSIDSFVYNLSSEPAGTTATIQFSQNSSTWYNSAGSSGGSDALDTGTNNTINLSSLGWSGSSFYYKVTFTSDGINTPVLADITLNYTPASAPTVTTQAPTSVEATTATGNGNITSTGGETVTRRGFCYMVGTSGDPTTSNSVAYDDGSFGAGAYTKGITGLTSGTNYRVRAYAVNSLGTSYGETVQITMKPAAPTAVSATDGTYTDKVRITWTKSTGATDYHVWRGSTDLGSAGDVDLFDDTGSAAGVITPGTATASDGISEDHVSLNLSGSSVATGTSYSYKVVASNSSGNSTDSATDAGYRGVGSLAYQWQRSGSDADGDYSNISGATTVSYNDTGAPSIGSVRYYRCVVSADGAVTQNSNSDTGYRIGVIPCSAHNVSGYAWSDNIGWISFSCRNQWGIGEGREYGVDVSDYNFSGYAWSDNIGWINMSPSGTYPASPSYSAKTDGSGNVSGWARACSVFESGCSGTLKPDTERGGWDGWIAMSGTGYQVSINSGAFVGYAWNNVVEGWTSFNGVLTTLTFNEPPEDITASDMSFEKLGGCSYAIEIPVLNWTYDDPNDDPLGTDPQAAYQIRIDNDSTFGVDSNDNAVLDADEFTCSGLVCSGESSTSFSPFANAWIAWADYGETYYWKVRVKDSNNNWSEWSEFDSFSSAAHTYPEPDFTHAPEVPGVGDEVGFTDLSICYDSLNAPYNCKDGSARYVWNFGDGTTCDSNNNPACKGNATHTYTGISEYVVSLEVTDSVGACSSQGDTENNPIDTSIPTPDYKEVPPSSILNRLFSNIINFLKKLSLASN